MEFRYNLTIKSDLKLSLFERRRVGWWNNCPKHSWYSPSISHLLGEPRLVPEGCAVCMPVGSCYSMGANVRVGPAITVYTNLKSLRESLKKTIFNEHSLKRWLICSWAVTKNVISEVWKRFYTQCNCLPIM